MADITDMIMQYSQQYKSPITAGLEGVLLGRELRQKKMQSELDNRIKKFEMERAERLLPHEIRSQKAQADIYESTAKFIGPEKEAEIEKTKAKAQLDLIQAQQPDIEFLKSADTIWAFDKKHGNFFNTEIPAQQAKGTNIEVKTIDKMGDQLIEEMQGPAAAAASIPSIMQAKELLDSGKVNRTSKAATLQTALSGVWDAMGLDPDMLGPVYIKGVENYEQFNSHMMDAALGRLPGLKLNPITPEEIKVAESLFPGLDYTKEANIPLMRLLVASASKSKLQYNALVDGLAETDLSRADALKLNMDIKSAPNIHTITDSRGNKTAIYFDQFIEQAAQGNILKKEGKPVKFDLRKAGDVQKLIEAWREFTGSL